VEVDDNTSRTNANAENTKAANNEPLLLGVFISGSLMMREISREIKARLEIQNSIMRRYHIHRGCKKSMPHLHRHRFPYYRQAFDALLAMPEPLGVLWPLLTTWLDAVSPLPEDHPALEPFRETLHTLGMLNAAFSARLSGLDAFLDHVEDILDAWGRKNGVS